MKYCMYCGVMLPEGARFCSACGAAVTQEAVVSAASAAVPTVASSVVYAGDGYAVMLLSAGSCALSTAADLISDTCGYTDAEAMNLIANAPTLIAQSLDRNQAAYLAQCLTEYGMEAVIYDRNGNQTFSSDVDTVFSSNGSLLTKVAAALGLIGIGNRIAGTIHRLTLPVRPPVYTLRRPVQRPPVRRQAIHHATAPGQGLPHYPEPVPAGHQPRSNPPEHRTPAPHRGPEQNLGQQRRRSAKQLPHGNKPHRK